MTAPAPALPPGWLQRLLLEHRALAKRELRLSEFVRVDPGFKQLPEAEQVRIRCQLQFMTGYLFTLSARIHAAQGFNIAAHPG